MNILIPHTWLLEHLDTQAQPEEIQKYLSLCGPSVERIYDRDGDKVYDIEVTTNRVDSMSVRGIAREAAVILPQFGIKARLKPLQVRLPQPSTSASLPLPKITNNPEYCHRIMCVTLADVAKTPTPDWMAKRLQQIEVNVHDSMIDITNYVTHDLGHPCHAFDYDQIMKLGGEIIVTEAKAGKKFTTLDGVEYTTVGGEIVFENPAGEIIDLPAVKGTANTALNDNTKNVLFWIEALDHEKVRFASMTHAIRTVAAQLNEKQVDPHLAEPVLAEAVRYYQELCQAQVASEVYDDFPGRVEPSTVTVSLHQIRDYLGLELSLERIQDILEQLECQVTVDLGSRELTVKPPTFRPDLQIPADVIEEIARIYGYHNLPSVIMATEIPLKPQPGVSFAVEDRIKHFLADIGWQEMYTYSLVSAELAEQSGYSLPEHLKLANPLTDDKVYLRRSLLPSLSEVIGQNTQAKSLSVFEIANVYQPVKNSVPNEVLHLSLVTTTDFRSVKGVVEALLDRLFVRKYAVQPSDTTSFNQSGAILAENEDGELIEIGTIGKLENGYLAADIIVPDLLKVIHKHPIYQPIPKTSPVIEDLTFTLPSRTTIGKVLAKMTAVSELIQSVTLHDQYQQNFSFTVTYIDPTNNLSGQDVEPIRKKIVSMMQHEFNAQLVGSV